MSNLKRHERKDRIKWLATFIGFLLLAAAIVGLSLQLFGKDKQKPSEWFKKDETQIEQTLDNTDTDIKPVSVSAFNETIARTSEAATENRNILGPNSTPQDISVGNDLSGVTVYGYTITEGNSFYYNSFPTITSSNGYVIKAYMGHSSYYDVRVCDPTGTKIAVLYEYNSGETVSIGTEITLPEDFGSVLSCTYPDSSIPGSIKYGAKFYCKYGFSDYTFADAESFDTSMSDENLLDYCGGFIAVDLTALKALGATDGNVLRFNTQYTLKLNGNNLLLDAGGHTVFNIIISPCDYTYLYYSYDITRAYYFDLRYASAVKYLYTATYDVTVNSNGKTHVEQVMHGKVLTVTDVARCAIDSMYCSEVWLNDDGISPDNIIASTEFTHAYNIQLGHQNVQMKNPYGGYTFTTITSGVNGDSDNSISRMFYNVGAVDGKPYLLWQCENLYNYAKTWFIDLDMKEIPVTLTFTALDTAARDEKYVFTTTLSDIYNSYGTGYKGVLIDVSSSRVPVTAFADQTTMLVNIGIKNDVVTDEARNVKVVLYNDIDKHYTVPGHYVEYWNNEIDYCFSLTELNKIYSEYDSKIFTFETENEKNDAAGWRFRTADDKQYAFNPATADTVFYLKVTGTHITLLNDVNENSVDLILQGTEDNYYIQLDFKPKTVMEEQGVPDIAGVTYSLKGSQMLYFITKMNEGFSDPKTYFDPAYISLFSTLLTLDNYEAFGDWALTGRYNFAGFGGFDRVGYMMSSGALKEVSSFEFDIMGFAGMDIGFGGFKLYLSEYMEITPNMTFKCPIMRKPDFEKMLDDKYDSKWQEVGAKFGEVCGEVVNLFDKAWDFSVKVVDTAFEIGNDVVDTVGTVASSALTAVDKAAKGFAGFDWTLVMKIVLGVLCVFAVIWVLMKFISICKSRR